jgi:hypothetical protein
LYRILSGKLHHGPREVRVRKAATLIIIAAFAVIGCNRDKNAGPGDTKTETIAPAAAQPAPTDTAELSQTTGVEDSRSEAEGGTATADTTMPAGPTGATATTATTATTTTAKSTKKKSQ